MVVLLFVAIGCGSGQELHHVDVVSQGIYVSDPDGNLLELYVGSDPSLWRQDPALVARSDALELES